MGRMASSCSTRMVLPALMTRGPSRILVLMVRCGNHGRGRDPPFTTRPGIHGPRAQKGVHTCTMSSSIRVDAAWPGCPAIWIWLRSVVAETALRVGSRDGNRTEDASLCCIAGFAFARAVPVNRYGGELRGERASAGRRARGDRDASERLPSHLDAHVCPRWRAILVHTEALRPRR